MLPINTVEITRKLLNHFLTGNEICVDMTLGHGKDSLWILKQIPQGFLYGFDLQEKAIRSSAKLLSDFTNKRLIHDSHENVDKYIKEANLFIYNLGYLPGGDKTITTDKITVYRSLKKAMDLLLPKGLIIMTFYPGHPSGKEEEMYLLKKIKEFDQKQWNCMKYDFINQKNNPPFVLVLEKL
ncbi:MAG: class I SAM-dependent methyltransferase [Tissierellia bacterium]|nr:class I SAM-dependent methyltransferase [Tissierellia bacterium]